jgi:hypothetical protein
MMRKVVKLENRYEAKIRSKKGVSLTVSYIANPAVTLPPGELMYSEMGEVDSASRKSSCATTTDESASSI